MKEIAILDVTCNYNDYYGDNQLDDIISAKITEWTTVSDGDYNILKNYLAKKRDLIMITKLDPKVIIPKMISDYLSDAKKFEDSLSIARKKEQERIQKRKETMEAKRLEKERKKFEELKQKFSNT